MLYNSHSRSDNGDNTKEVIMKYLIEEFKQLRELGTGNRGITFMHMNRNNYLDENDSVRLLSILDIQNLDENKEQHKRYCNKYEIEKKIKKNDCYAEKNDIIFSLAPRTYSKNIYYIEKEPNEKMVYNDTIFVFRATDSNISSDYIYMTLSSDFFSKYIATRAGGRGIIRNRLNIDEILDISIPILVKEQREFLTQNFYELRHQQELMRQRLDDITTYGNGKTIETV